MQGAGGTPSGEQGQQQQSSGEQGQQGQQDGGQQQQQQPPTPEQWYSTLSADQKAQVDAWHNDQSSGLKSALQTERERNRTARQQIETEIRASAKSAAESKNVELEKRLTEQADALVTAQKEANFYEGAFASGVRRNMLRPAWQMVQADDLWKKNGEPDWDELKSKYPEFFDAPGEQQQQRVPGNAGNGAGARPSGPTSMNDLIRAAARGG